MHSTKYRDLLALLILLDEVESRAKALGEQFPELRTVAEATSDAADLCDLAVTVEDIGKEKKEKRTRYPTASYLPRTYRFRIDRRRGA